GRTRRCAAAERNAASAKQWAARPALVDSQWGRTVRKKVPLAKTPCGWLHLVSGTAAPGIRAGATRLAVWWELCSGGHQPATLYRRASRRVLRNGHRDPRRKFASGMPALHAAANSSWGTWAAAAAIGSSSTPP